MDVERHLATRLSALRRERGWTLEQLAGLSGVSRSMISLIERAATSPTAAVLDKLAGAFGVTLAALFTEDAPGEAASPLSRHAQQAVWTDPASGYLRRHLTPPGVGAPLELAEIEFPPGRTVSFDAPQRRALTHQQVWMLEGEMEVRSGGATWRLQPGDCLALVLETGISFRNPTRRPARYAIALTTTAPSPAPRP